MKTYIKIIARNKNSNINQEFKCRNSDDFNDNVYRGYSQVPFIIFENDIINNIKNGKDYRTSDDTKCEISTRNGVEYITTDKNDSTKDNILTLPTY